MNWKAEMKLNEWLIECNIKLSGTFGVMFR